jgi:hypothetical protein
LRYDSSTKGTTNNPVEKLYHIDDLAEEDRVTFLARRSMETQRKKKIMFGRKVSEDARRFWLFRWPYNAPHAFCIVFLK